MTAKSRFIPGRRIERKWGVHASWQSSCHGDAAWDYPVAEIQHEKGTIAAGPASAIVVD